VKYTIAGLIAVLLAFGSLPVGADGPPGLNPLQSVCSAVRVTLFNPQPGALITPGSYVIEGSAVDDTAPTPPGVDRVQIFFDQPRDSGGRFIGEVDADQDTANQRLSARGFAVQARIPNTTVPNNTHALFVYARSAVTGQEQVVTESVQLNLPLKVGPFTPTPTTPPVQLSLPTCGTPAPTPTFPPFPATVANATPGASDSLTLQVANPQPGDTLPGGMYAIGGLAFDSSAASGTGIQQVQVFLDPRDSGGQFLGTATLGAASGGGSVFGFELLVPLPDRAGAHTLSVYAVSSVSSRETSVSIPITID